MRKVEVTKNNSWKVICKVALWTCCIFPSPVAAWPFGPGRCTSGTPVREPHVSDPTGELADAGYEILINGLPLTKLSTTDISIDVPYTWELRRKEGGQESSFRGFLVHFTETTRQADLSDILSIGDDSEGLAKVLTDAAGWPSCGRNNVAAGHLNNWEKQSVGGELIFDEVGEIDLEISVVAANKGNANRWYYTKYFLSITDSPVSMQAPLTPAPTPSPTPNPTPNPTPSPTPNPTPQPTPTPTPSPTPATVSESSETLLPTSISSSTPTFTEAPKESSVAATNEPSVLVPTNVPSQIPSAVESGSSAPTKEPCPVFFFFPVCV